MRVASRGYLRFTAAGMGRKTTFRAVADARRSSGTTRAGNPVHYVHFAVGGLGIPNCIRRACHERATELPFAASGRHSEHRCTPDSRLWTGLQEPPARPIGRCPANENARG